MINFFRFSSGQRRFAFLLFCLVVYRLSYSHMLTTDIATHTNTPGLLFLSFAFAFMAIIILGFIAVGIVGFAQWFKMEIIDKW